MERTYPVKSRQTLSTINRLLSQGIDRMSVIIRHSDRHYPKAVHMEPFMGLTEKGKTYAHELGQGLPETLCPKMFSSHFGRCIETAYLIDKGYTASHSKTAPHNQTCDLLTPFYIKDIEQALTLMLKAGSQQFIRNWFDDQVDRQVMADPRDTAQAITDFMTGCLTDLDEGQIAICVSHDWNIFPVKEFKLDLKHEAAGDVGYLDGVVFYQENDRFWAVTHQTDPVAL